MASLFSKISAEARRLGVKKITHGNLTKALAKYRIREKEIVLNLNEADITSLTHEIIHFLQLEYGFFLWGEKEKEALAQTKRGESLDIWGLELDAVSFLEIASQVMDEYPPSHVKFEVAAHYLEDFPELILRVMKEL